MLAEDAIKAAIRDYHSKIKGKSEGIAGSIDVSQSVSVTHAKFAQMLMLSF